LLTRLLLLGLLLPGLLLGLGPGLVLGALRLLAGLAFGLGLLLVLSAFGLGAFGLCLLLVLRAGLLARRLLLLAPLRLFNLLSAGLFAVRLLLRLLASRLLERLAAAIVVAGVRLFGGAALLERGLPLGLRLLALLGLRLQLRVAALELHAPLQVLAHLGAVLADVRVRPRPLVRQPGAPDLGAGLPLALLGLEAAQFAIVVAGAPLAPVGLLAAGAQPRVGRPHQPRRLVHPGPLGHLDPRRGAARLPQVVPAGVVAARGRRHAVSQVARQVAAAGVEHDHQHPAAVVAVAVVAVAHEVRIGRARLVIVVAVAVVPGLGVHHPVVRRLPDVGLLVVIGEAVVRRDVIDRLLQAVGPFRQRVAARGAVVADSRRRGRRQVVHDRQFRQRGRVRRVDASAAVVVFAGAHRQGQSAGGEKLEGKTAAGHGGLLVSLGAAGCASRLNRVLTGTLLAVQGCGGDVAKLGRKPRFPDHSSGFSSVANANSQSKAPSVGVNPVDHGRSVPDIRIQSADTAP
jgi:hypothetical protein